MTPLVFLHVPKTAGQAVHNELVNIVGGPDYASPVRVATQAIEGRQMPEGYRLYSGHIDWTELDTLPSDRFAFTILRDPRERIASFYLYMRKLAKASAPADLSKPANYGKKMALELSADDYFFSGAPDWQRFVRAMYDNFYCSYFATRRMEGWGSLQTVPPTDRVDRALKGLHALNAVYCIDNLTELERDIELLTGQPIRVAGEYFNSGGHEMHEPRWPKLCRRFEADKTVQRLEQFYRLDEALMQQVFKS